MEYNRWRPSQGCLRGKVAGKAKKRLKAGELDHTLGYKLRLAQIASYRSFEERHASLGVAPRYFGLLMVIAANPGQPQSALAHAIAVRRSSIVPILDRLAAEGLVERASGPDRRTNAVSLTAKGEAMVARLKAIAQADELRLHEGLDPAHVEIAISVLDHVIERLDRPRD